MTTRRVDIEGQSPDDMLELLDIGLGEILFDGDPIAFHAGTAYVLGAFTLEPQRLVVELAEIQGGGEGVLRAIRNLATRFAVRKNLGSVEWIVYAADCAEPNLKLRRMLERRGFALEDVPGKGRAYRFLQMVEE